MCNHVCFNYRGISWWGDPYSFVSDIPSGPNVQANVTFFFISRDIRVSLWHPSVWQKYCQISDYHWWHKGRTALTENLPNFFYLFCIFWVLIGLLFRHWAILWPAPFLAQVSSSPSSSRAPTPLVHLHRLTNLTSLVCSLQSFWQSMYPQAKPNKLISQPPLYTVPPTKRLMAGMYNPSQNNHRDANCIPL